MAAKPTLKRQESAAAAPDAQRLRAVAGYFQDRDAGETDRLIYERVRLGIMSALSVNPSMTFAELMTLVDRLELRDALNLDGGGSTTMIVKGVMVNKPSDPAGARAVSDAIIVR